MDKEEQSNIVKVLQDVQTVNQQMQEIIDRLQDDNAALQVQNETWTRVSQSESTMEMAEFLGDSIVKTELGETLAYFLVKGDRQ